MVSSALLSFGLAIGSMDIFGAVCFQLLVIVLIRLANDNEPGLADDLTTDSSLQLNASVQDKKRAYFCYFIVLNAWIAVSVLMMYGIMTHNAAYMRPWLVWCSAGLLLDAAFMLWWCAELATGDVIEALTNILISVLTMSIEILFLIIIYRIYTNMRAKSSERVLSDL